MRGASLTLASSLTGFWIRRPSPNHGAAANGLSAVRLSVAEVCERTVRSTAAAKTVAELGRWR